nr:MAG: hypothetical protein [Halyomorpha halys reo-like associated virus 1]
MLKLIIPKILTPIGDGEHSNKYRINVVPVNTGIINILNDFINVDDGLVKDDLGFAKWLDSTSLKSKPLYHVIRGAVSYASKTIGSPTDGKKVFKIRKNENEVRDFFCIGTNAYKFSKGTSDVQLSYNVRNVDSNILDCQILGIQHYKWLKDNRSNLDSILHNVDITTSTFMNLAASYRSDVGNNELFSKPEVAIRSHKTSAISTYGSQFKLLCSHFKRGQQLLALSAVVNSLNEYINNKYPTGMSADDVNTVYEQIRKLGCSFKCSAAIAMEYMLNGNTPLLCDTWHFLLSNGDLNQYVIRPSIMCGIPAEKEYDIIMNKDTVIRGFVSNGGNYILIISTDVTENILNYLSDLNNKIEFTFPVRSKCVLLLIRNHGDGYKDDTVRRSLPWRNGSDGIIYKFAPIEKSIKRIQDDIFSLFNIFMSINPTVGDDNKTRRTFRDKFESHPYIIYAAQLSRHSPSYNCILHSILNRSRCSHILSAISACENIVGVDVNRTVFNKVLLTGDQHTIDDSVRQFLGFFGLM